MVKKQLKEDITQKLMLLYKKMEGCSQEGQGVG